jgi:glutamyl-tRNA synthetase
MVKERVNFVKEIWDQTDFFFKAPELYDQEVIKKRWTNETCLQLTELKSFLEDSADFSSTATESVVKDWIAKKGYNTGAIMSALRLVIVGTSRGPHIFDIISWIGKAETLRRIETGVSVICKIQI